MVPVLATAAINVMLGRAGVARGSGVIPRSAP
jgi:hypothetical protein